MISPRNTFTYFVHDQQTYALCSTCFLYFKDTRKLAFGEVFLDSKILLKNEHADCERQLVARRAVQLLENEVNYAIKAAAFVRFVYSKTNLR